MFKLLIKPQLQLASGDDRHLLPRIVELLTGIEETSTLAGATSRMGLSYRHAWNILQAGNEVFGAPLAESRRGQGARLTALGDKLVWANRRINARLSPMLDSLATELEVELERALSHVQGALRIQASHGFAIELLKEWFTSRHMPLDLKYRSSQESLAALCSGACDVATLHIPIGEFQSEALTQYSRWLRADSHRLILLATRRQGLMVSAGDPLGIGGIADLPHPRLRFINRQTGSGTRILFDLLLRKAQIDSSTIKGYDAVEYTHAAVAAYIASGMADAGFGVETPAKRFGLDFIPLVTERYFLVCNADALASTAITRVIDSLCTTEFKNRINSLAGYDGMQSGSVLTLREAFHDMPSPPVHP